MSSSNASGDDNFAYVDESNPDALRAVLRAAWISGRSVTLSSDSAGLASRLMLHDGQDENPLGTHDCFSCEGKGVIHNCVVCGSERGGEGTCGSDDPRALCNYKPAERNAESIRSQQISAISSLQNRLVEVGRGRSDDALEGVLRMPEWDVLAHSVDAKPLLSPSFSSQVSIHQDELEAATAGSDWLDGFRNQNNRLDILETTTPGRVPRVKWAALFDVRDRLTHAYLLTRDEMNRTQLTLVTTDMAVVES